MPKKLAVIYTVLIVLILAVCYASITMGAFSIDDPSELFSTLFQINPNEQYSILLFDLRLPRIVTAGLVGLGLGIAGAVIQAVTRNGLADPGILGINAGAGAAIVGYMLIFQGQTETANLLAAMGMPFFGLIGGLLAAAFIFMFAWHGGNLDSGRIILVGIAINSGFSAVSLYLSLKMNPNDYEMAMVWKNGSIGSANWAYIQAALPWFLLLIPFLLAKSRLLDTIRFHEDTVKSLGVSSNLEKAVLLIACVGIISACVSISGSMSFVGLIAPHISRRLAGVLHRYSLPLSGLIGMFLVLCADFAGKLLFQPSEVPAGILLAIFGVPYFLYLLFKQKKAVQ
ncbi:iron ABC transporter permease [Bacillus sonorensis]|uniref:Siderophore ABC transporter permease FeuC n=2 Tax=Bacillus sonorensis TaxID=119858 RepID=M5P217_9BACI|nr:MULTISPECIES: iron ABC transporter permease [Bacillus]TWK80677.1 Iron-uptake system permease protein FeuC [Bacillus paralicheniformis]ASB87040.1 Iron-uptake system permease protein FeuC [Bacillus sonorensis]EME73473.1 siderophore ABC transporter permease FeuC [Bacillus sonorensis L12]MBG9914449.1 iron ABC transporter permease [Bacillus sonorensis]MCF7616290.1 iron ABC transporter permease [Bacillus sonorensis]